ncbi:hypothetical protein HK104_003197, partial [Borealophlyctis nickersoniae]
KSENAADNESTEIGGKGRDGVVEDKKPKEEERFSRKSRNVRVGQTFTVLRGKEEPVSRPIPLRSLVPSNVPVLEHLSERIHSPAEHINLDNETFPYPVHPSTKAELRFLASALLDPKLRLNHVDQIPSARESILILSCPFRGSELYLRAVTEAIASENNALFISVTNNDLFPRVSADKVVNNPPWHTADFEVSNAKKRGRKDKILGQGNFGMVILPGGSMGGHGPQGQDTDANDERPFLPYPWFKAYGSGQDNLSVMCRPTSEGKSDAQKLVALGLNNFFRGLREQAGSQPVVVFYEDLMNLLSAEGLSSHETLATLSRSLIQARTKGEILLVAPSTTTHAKAGDQSSGQGGLMELLQNIRKSGNEEEGGGYDPEDGGSGGGSSQKQSALRYKTLIDEYLGAPIVNVLPPMGGDLKDFHDRMKEDYQTIVRSTNLRELQLAASAASIIWELGEVNEALEKASKAGRGVARYSQTAGLDETFLTPLEVERLVLLMLGSSKGEGTSNESSDGSLRVSATAFLRACATYSAVAHGLEDVKGGVDYAGVFRNPRDRGRLSKHEERLLNQCLVKPAMMSTTFSSVGGLARTKRVIDELIRLPLQRPELFKTGILKQSTTGILLFGPPGTGKTMLARAVAGESGANFLNVQMSHVSSMWVGENEKNVRALFSLARKLKPCVIFVDEIDALLRGRQGHQPSWVTNTINEFMMEWDGVQSDPSGVIVVGATNRPFDLDEAVLRRLPRRILVDLPDKGERQEILDVLLKEEIVGSESAEDRKSVIEELANTTEGFSGSDLKNLCIAAALNAIRDKLAAQTSSSSTSTHPSTLLLSSSFGRAMADEDLQRVLVSTHFTRAIESGDVVPSLNDRADLVRQLKQWDKVYGTGAGGYGKGGNAWGFELNLTPNKPPPSTAT